jgi:dephospho-CoA kinase
MVTLKIIGVTGGIGSGKSAVSRILRDLGAAVVDADIIAKSVISSSGKAFDELVDYFGTDIVGENGEIDRSKLAEKAFSDKVMLHTLNSITHKHVSESS